MDLNSLLKDFDLEHKNSSEDALRRWRSAVSIVKNRRRRFLYVADLARRAEAEKKKRNIQVLFYRCLYFSHYNSSIVIYFSKLSIISSATTWKSPETVQIQANLSSTSFSPNLMQPIYFDF